MRDPLFLDPSLFVSIEPARLRGVVGSASCLESLSHIHEFVS